MQELIAKLEATTKGNRELDKAIAWLQAPEHQRKRFYPNGMNDNWYPYFSTSIDAALTLLSKDRLWSIGSIVNGSGFVAILNNDGRSHRGATPALALCIAALRAQS